jgi:class 3 adenylate cyclase
VNILSPPSRFAPIDDFEQARRVQETRNEITITWINLIFVTTTLMNWFVNEYLFRWLPFSSPPQLFLIAGFGVVYCLAVLIYLHRTTSYWRGRQYLFVVIETLIVTLGTFVLRGAIPISVLYEGLMGVYILTIVLAGLRYNTRIVIFSGLLTSLLYILIGFLYPAEPLAPTFLLVMIGLLCFLTATISVAFSVVSLIQLHRDSILKERLGRFLAPELVQELSRRPEMMARQTERRVATVLFTDIRGFTALSERLTPEEVVAFLNLFLEEMTAAIMGHQGMVDKYIGDAVMGVFGVPIATREHATLAVQAGIDMQARLVALNRSLGQQQLPELRLGVGIHTGELVIGAIGAAHRLDYTVIGDTVNVAARIETLTRQYEVPILLSETTQAMLAPGVQTREVGTTVVRNRAQPITLWTPVGGKDE